MNKPLLLRPGMSDLLCALLLTIGSAVGIQLEPSNRDFWLYVPLSVAAPLLITAALLALNLRVTTVLAAAIHALLLIVFALGVLLCLFLFVTIIFFGTALVLFPPFVGLAANSFFVLRQIVKPRKRLRPSETMSAAS